MPGLIQESKHSLIVSPVNRTVKKFDPLYTRRKKDAFPNLDRIIELFDRGTPGEQGRPSKKQRTLTWKFTTGVAKPLAPQMTNKLIINNLLAQGTKLITSLPMSLKT